MIRTCKERQKALLRAARRARETARKTGTAIVVMRDGKLIEEEVVETTAGE
jgi:argonaute-like protein implicated in RNA metabolism and viral defense